MIDLACLDQIKRKNKCAYYHYNNGKPARKLVEALLKRSFSLLCLVHQGGDLADFGVHSRCGDNHKCSAVGNKAAGEHHVPALSKRSLALDYVVILINVSRFTGQRAFVDLQRIVVDDPAVGNDQVACLKHDDIARYNVL